MLVYCTVSIVLRVQSKKTNDETDYLIKRLLKEESE